MAPRAPQNAHDSGSCKICEDLDSDPQRRRRDAVTFAILSRGEMLFANYRRRDKLFAMLKANLVLALLTILAGALVGLIVSLFRLALNHGERLRDLLILWAHGSPVLGFVLVVATLASAAAVGSWLVRRFSPYAAGSGIPHVEAAVHGELPPAPISLLPVKFIGGWLAIAGGLALGREGPCVQMGATTAEIFHRLFRPRSTDARILLAAGAGAGLASAFNAPAAGAVFVLEELVKRFETRIAIAALGASAGAICVSRLFVGDAPEFHVAPLTYPDFNFSVWCAALGVVAGFVGVAYNRAILGALRTNDRLHRWPVELRASVIGAAVGVLAWFAPGLVRRGRSIDTARALGARCDSGFTVRVPGAFRTRGRVLFGGRVGWFVRADAHTRRTAGRDLRHGLPAQCLGSSSGRDGGVFHGGGARAVDRHCAHHRDDW